MTEWEKLQTGQLYNDFDRGLFSAASRPSACSARTTGRMTMSRRNAAR